MKTSTRVGAIVPPKYFDTSGKELISIAPEIDLLHTQMRLSRDFGFSLHEIAAAGGEVEACARSLADAGADVVIQLGTPFSTAHGWREGNQLQDRIEAQIGVPFEMMGLSVPAGVLAIGARRVVMATTYYSPEWVDRYTTFLADAGIEVLASEGFVDQGVFKTPEDAFAASFDGFDSDALVDTIREVAGKHPDADCILMPGLPGRFLHRVAELETELTIPVVSYFSIWWRCLARLGIAPNDDYGTLLRLTAGAGR